ncbi:MAG: hydrogenase expression/formation protein HypE [Pseudomonadota bacterium]
MDKVTLNLGSGGREMHNFISGYIIKRLSNSVLNKLDDSAVLLNRPDLRIAVTTDSYVVSPLFFPGGDIGKLCICGTVNDLSTSGAKPYAITLSFILEEGTPLEILKKIIDSIAKTAKQADVKIVTGDTKVVEKGKCDGVYINTCGIGFIKKGINLSTHNAKQGDVVLVTRSIGNHEATLLKYRGVIKFDAEIKSDVAPLNKKVEELLSLTKNIHVIKDPTRGGTASALYEICEHSKCGIRLFEKNIPVDKNVKALCALIGYDPLYLANEGCYIVVCPKGSEKYVKKVFGAHAVVIGEVISSKKAELTVETKIGGIRKLGMLETMQLPRIC